MAAADKLATVMADAKAVKTRAVEELKETVKAPEKTDVWKSVLRVKHDETPRSRALGVLSNVFLHLHPAKINRDAVAYNYTWGMGGMTFYVYITLVFTGTLLMFYYHPSQGGGLPRHSVPGKRRPVRQAAAQHAPLGRAPDGDHGGAAHVPRVPHRVVQETARVQLGGGSAAAGADAAAELHRLSAARRSARILGGHGGNQHGARHAAAWGTTVRSVRSWG